jgi:hypothetical protein
MAGMSMRDARRRGQMTPRSQRTWRDETNPAGPTSVDEEAAPTEPPEPAEQAESEESPTSGKNEATPATSGPGGGGATQWSGRAKRHQGLHGGPSRKP